MSRPPTLLWTRLGGVLLLRPAAFAEVADDRAASPQAGILVLATAALEAASHAAIHGEPLLDGGDLLVAELAALIGWALWSAILYGLAVRAAGHRAEFAAVVRAVGFAHAPSLVLAVGIVPGASLLVGTLYIVALGWFVAALVAAVRGVFDLPIGRAALLTGAALLAHELIRQAARLLGLAP